MHSSIRPNLTETSTWQSWLTTAALVLLLALVIGRGTMHENLRDATPVNPGDVSTPQDAGPATSLLIDVALMLPASMILLRAALDRRFKISLEWSHTLFAGFAIFAWISVFWADDRFAAAVNATHLVAAAAAMWASTQLFRDGLRLRLIAGVCASLLMIYTAHGLIYRLVDVPENVRYWQEHRDEELARRGWKPDSFEAHQFEKKLSSGEMIGFSTSPNTFAATLVLAGIVLAGAIIQRIVDRDEIGWPIALALPLLPAAWILTLTQSKAAVTAPVIAAAVFAIIALCGAMLRRHLRNVFLAGVIASVIFLVVVIGFGITQQRLPSASLAFRWNYWVGGWRIFTQHPLIGIGWTSFADRYLAARLPVAAEEVKDPHNFLVRGFVELGVIGGMILLAWLIRLIWEMLAAKPQLDSNESPDRRGTAAIIGAIALLGFIVGVLGAVDLTSTASNEWFILLQVLQRLLYFGLMLLALSGTTLRSSTLPILDRRPAIWIARALTVGAGVFLVQNLIDFSLFEPGTMTVFAVIAGASIARFDPDPRPASTETRVLGLTAVSVVALLMVFAVWLPVMIAETRANAADEALRGNDIYTASEAFRKAYDGLWIGNSDYAFRAALALERTADVRVSTVLPLLQTAIRANPFDPQPYRNRAALLLSKPNLDARQIIADYTRALEIDPNEASLRLEFGEALLALKQTMRAKEEFEAALRFNDMLNPDEPKRLSRERVADVRERIARLG